jgi:acetyl-CoA acyltransferase
MSREAKTFSYNSHQKAMNAIERIFKSGILPVTVEEVYVGAKKKQQKVLW